MVAEEILRQKPKDPKLSDKEPSKSVKLNRPSCLVGVSADLHRKQKFNGDRKREANQEDCGRKQRHNGCTEVEKVAASEELLQENVVSCASENCMDAGPNPESAMETRDARDDALPVTTSGLDENCNVLQDESDSKQIPCNDQNRQSPIKEKDPAEEQVLSLGIPEHKSDAKPCTIAANDDLPVQSTNGENYYAALSEKKGEADDSAASEYKNGTKVLEEKHGEESCKKREQRDGADKKTKEREQRDGADKKTKERKEEKRKDKKEGEKDKTREKSKEQVKEEAGKEDKKQKSSGSDRKKEDDAQKQKDKYKEDKRKEQSGKSNHNHKVKKETSDSHVLPKVNGRDVKGGLKMTLVDLDLFQERLAGDRRQKSKGKSRDKKGSGIKDNEKKGDIKEPKRHEDEEPKGIKRELEGKKESSRSRKKSKPDPEEEEKVKPRSKKRKSAEEAGETKAKKKEKEESKWKWWEEKNHEDGVKWKFLEHRGPYFAPPYEPLPDDVNFHYDGQLMKLSPAAEEVATFYGKMLDHEYTTKEIFQNNFFTDWRTQMTKEEKKTIKQLYKCDFSEIHKYFFDKNEARKALPKEEKQKLKEESSKIQEEYGFCTLDGHCEKIGNFKIEPPGLFRGRGDHPKMGMLKLRIKPEDVIINCSKESKVPEPPPGHRWKEVRCDNTVTWLASWTENIQGSIKYIMLNPSSKLKGEKDWQKYETARRLKSVVGQIRSQYRLDWKSREMKKRQRAVALYFIDKLALRAGNEKEEGETADTVGCCSLRVEHIKLYPELDGQQHVVEFDFLGKDSIRYYNKVPVEKEVYKNLNRFMENKDPEDDLFDRLNTSILNKHLQDLMDGLSAKVFRTYNASITLQNQLKQLTDPNDNVAAKILSYNRANRAVALLCNHQRAPPKTFEKSMQNLQTKIDAKEQQLKEAKKELKKAKADYKAHETERNRKEMEKKKKQVERLEEQLMKLKLQATDKEENKQIALGTSKLNYLDPRITVAWCKKYGVPIEKIYNKTQRDKFAWAIDMTSEDFEF